MVKAIVAEKNTGAASASVSCIFGIHGLRKFFHFQHKKKRQDGSDGLSHRAELFHGQPLLIHQAVGVQIQRGFGAAVPKQRAHGFHIHAQLHHACGEGVSKS